MLHEATGGVVVVEGYSRVGIDAGHLHGGSLLGGLVGGPWRSVGAGYWRPGGAHLDPRGLLWMLQGEEEVGDDWNCKIPEMHCNLHSFLYK